MPSGAALSNPLTPSPKLLRVLAVPYSRISCILICMNKRFITNISVLFLILLPLLIGPWSDSGTLRAQAIYSLPAAEARCQISSSQTMTDSLQSDKTASRCALSPGAWKVKASLGTEVYGNGIASDGIYVYSVGGHKLLEIGGIVSNLFARYDPRADTWTSLVPLPTPVYDAVVIYAEGKLYVFGGMIDALSVTDLVQIYDIGLETWSNGTPMPAPRQQMGGGYYNGKIYVVGGFQSDNMTDAKNATWEYTLAGGTWATKAPILNALGGPGSGVVNGHLYILGGRESSGAVLDTVYDYNISADAWMAVSTMPTLVNYPGSAVYGGRIWVFGGGNPYRANSAQSPESIESYNITQIFDPATNSFLAGPNQNVARSYQSGAVVENLIISVGGYDSGTKKSSNVVEVAEQKPLKILLAYANDNNTPPLTLQEQLLNLPSVGLVEFYDAGESTPSIAALQAYDVVVTVSNMGAFNSKELGNVFADYQDSGGVLVAFNFSFSSTRGLDGRWISGGYSPFNLTDATISVISSLGAYSVGHPLMAGISTFGAYYRQNLILASGAQLVASWADGSPLIATKGRAVGVNAYLGDLVDPWNGDYARLIVNAGYWLLQSSCTYLACNRATVIQGSLTAEDAVSMGRLNQNDTESTCDAPLACPGTSSGNTLHYDAYPFLNNTGKSQCVKVTLDPRSCTGTTYIQSSAYLGPYNPTNLCTNYLADIGASPAMAKSYSFTVPAWQSYTVIVNEVNPSAYCPAYTLVISAGDCPIKSTFLPELAR